MTAIERNGRTDPQCPGCGVIWHQSGNRTGHCSGCHRTFDSLSAFDRHRRDDAKGVRRCLDPAGLTQETGEPVFAARNGHGELDKATSYWRLVPSPEAIAHWAALRHATITEESA
jgi:hypothetical protein